MAKTAIPICVLSMALSLAVQTASAQPDAPQPEGAPADRAESDVMCEQDRIQMIRPDGRIACVYPATAERMGMRGWEVLQSEDSTTESAEMTESEDIRQSDDVDMRDDRSDDVTVPVADDGDSAAAVPDVSGDDSDTSLAGADDYRNDNDGDDNNDSPYYDEAIYHVAYGRITLEGLEKLPTDAFWSPYTRAYAEDVLMPRLAGAIGDKVILPVSSPGRSTDYYYTEMGNTFLAAHHRESHPDIITSLRYKIYQDLPPDDFEEFMRTFAANAGFNAPDVRAVDTIVTLYPSDDSSGGKIYAFTYSAGRDSFIEINVPRWSHEPVPPDYTLINRTEMERRAYDFVVRHMDMYNKDTCKLELREKKHVGALGGNIAGVPVGEVRIGNCLNPHIEGSVPVSMSIFIDRVTGEIMWPYGSGEVVRPDGSGKAPYYLTNDWFEKIKHDIPESAWVVNDEEDTS